MNISERTQDDIPVLELQGSMTIGRGHREFRERIQGLLGQGRTRIIADMKGVRTLDSAGIGELVAQHVSAKNRGGVLALVALSGRAGGALKTTQLAGVLQMYDTVDEAVEALS